MKRYVYLLLALILVVAGWVIRNQNSQEARRQAEAVMKQDLAGQPTDAAVADLQDFVRQHGGVTATFTLQGAYNRDVARAKEAIAAASATNSQIYADAQKACSGKSDSITQARCNQDYISKHLQSVSITAPHEPSLSNYQRVVKAPWWTPDLSGALLLGGVAALAIGLFNLRPRRRR